MRCYAIYEMQQEDNALNKPAVARCIAGHKHGYFTEATIIQKK